MIEFDVAIEGLAQIERDWIAAEKILVTHFERAVEEGAKAGVEASRQAIPVRTGALRRENLGRVTVREARAVWGEMRWNRRYASFIDQGTRPHPIDARRAPALFFYWERIGTFFVGPHVDHPGNPAFKFTEPAADKFVEVALRHVHKGIEEAATFIRLRRAGFQL